MSFAPNRTVAVLTPLVFAPLAGSVAVLAAKYFPGVDIDQGQVEAVFIAGATIAFAKAGLWLKGWQDWEKREQEGAAAGAAGGGVDDVDDAPDLEPDPEDAPGFEDELAGEDDVEDEIPDEDAIPAGV
jgi:hypothetical protein